MAIITRGNGGAGVTAGKVMMSQSQRANNWRALAVLVVLLALAAAALRQVSREGEPSAPQRETVTLTPVEQVTADETPNTPQSADLYPVHINRPKQPPALRTDQTDIAGDLVVINCSTCHTIRTPNKANNSTADLDEFHQGLTFEHGSMTCLTCHNPDDYDALRLADGSRLPFRDVMTLCGQCHGPQLRDYNHGVHGGMNGYWDRTKGPRYRNNCIDCHDPHAPAFPMMVPTFKPIDRFLTPPHSSSDEGSHG